MTSSGLEIGDSSDGEDDPSTALVVDRADLQNLMEVPFDDDDEEMMMDQDEVVLETISPKRRSRPSPTKSARSTKRNQTGAEGGKRKRRLITNLRPMSASGRGESPQPGTSRGSATSTLTLIQSVGSLLADDDDDDPDEEIRRATSQYLQGEMSATDFAARMEDFERYKVQQEGVEKANQPSLVLVNPSPLDKPPQDDVAAIPDPDPEEDSAAEAKLRGEFFRTGDDMATFSVRKKRKMPPTIKNMMGEAHVRCARGDLTGAESICLEIIKEQPTYKDPFHTLAMIYENQGRMKRALQFFLISGLLDPKNFDDWPRLAELSVEEGNIPQAVMCLRKAIMSHPANAKSYMRRSELLAETGDVRGALRGYHKALGMSEEDAETYMDVAKRVAGIHFKADELDQAYNVLMGAVTKFSDNVTTAEMNLLAEVCISLKKYVKAVTLFMRFSGVRFEPAIPKISFKERSSLTASLAEGGRSCCVPTTLHSDLTQKLCIILIHLEAFDMIKPVVTMLRETEPLETFGIQLYEIGEAYLAKQRFEESLSILETLVNTDKYSMAEIWLRYAECLFLLNRVEDSAEAYSTVIRLAPGHKVARLNLSVILQKLGRFDVALQSLSQHEMEDLIDQDLMVEKCNIFFSRNRLNEFYDTALQLFSRHCPEVRNYDEAHALVITSQTNQMLQGLRSLRIRKGDSLPDGDINRIDPKPTDNATGEWTVYLKLFATLLTLNRPDLLCRLAYTVWASPLFAKDVRMKKDLDLQVCYATILNCDNELGPIHVRSLISTFGLSTVILKLISLACRKSGHARYGRQLVRLLMKRPSDTRLMMLNAHISLMNGTYKYALMEYMAILQVRRDDPLLHLLVASTLMHICSQKSVTNRSELAVQGIAFIHRYAELRGGCGQEVWYNLGRFYHYLGLYRGAVTYYKRVLITEPLPDLRGDAIGYNVNDLRREAAFNLGQIYKSVGAWGLAKRYISRYCVI